jgi:hypothetical protein
MSPLLVCFFPLSYISPKMFQICCQKFQCCFLLLCCRLDAKNCKRINLGGSQAAGYLQRLLQLKYPGHLAAITLSRMEEILHEHSYIAEDYMEGNGEDGSCGVGDLWGSPYIVTSRILACSLFYFFFFFKAPLSSFGIDFLKILINW